MLERIVVVGTSAGGIEALRSLCATLPADFPAPIAVVMHSSPQSPGVLHDIINRAGPLRATVVRSGEHVKAGHIYVPAPDTHLLIEPGRVRLTRGPKENRFRPAIDPLFRTAAQVYGPAAIGVILTGNLDDGTAGLWAIKRLGGIAIVQDPADALFPSMPENARRHVAVDYSVPLSEMGPLLVRLTAAPVEREPVTVPEHMHVDIKIAREEDPLDAGLATVSTPSAIACPECHGVLMQMKEEGLIRFRCHTGHGYSADSLLAEIAEGIEDALWNAVRSLQEGGILMRQLAEHQTLAHAANNGGTLRDRAAALDRQANTVRALIQEGDGFSPKS